MTTKTLKTVVCAVFKGVYGVDVSEGCSTKGKKLVLNVGKVGIYDYCSERLVSFADKVKVLTGKVVEPLNSDTWVVC